MKAGEFQTFAEQVEAAINDALSPLTPEADDEDIDEKLQAIIGVLIHAALYRIALIKWPTEDLRGIAMQIIDISIEGNREIFNEAETALWEEIGR